MISVRYPPPPSAVCPRSSVAYRVSHTLSGFTESLRVFGETSWDHQSFFAGLWADMQSCILSLSIYQEMADAMIEHISQQIESASVPAHV
jgi:hypothetical protein